MTCERLGVVVTASLAVLLAAFDGGQAAPLVTNGGFEQTSGFNGTKQQYFSGLAVGWGMTSPNLSFLDAPGTADNPNLYLAVYGHFPATSPNGGNFYEADGDPVFRSSPITQTINGLVPGQTYKLSFYQAAGQQQGFGGASFEQWIVKLGNDTQNSPLMNLPGGHGGTIDDADVVPWQLVTMDFTATSTSEVLSFLANGTSSVNGPSVPPIVFLDGVSLDALAAGVPEPSNVLLTAAGLLGLGVVYVRQRRARLAAA